MATQKYLTTSQVGELLGLSTGALAQMRFKGTGPLYVKLGGRSVRYRQDDVEQWIEERIRRRTDERTAPKAG